MIKYNTICPRCAHAAAHCACRSSRKHVSFREPEVSHILFIPREVSAETAAANHEIARHRAYVRKYLRRTAVDKCQCNKKHCAANQRAAAMVFCKRADFIAELRFKRHKDGLVRCTACSYYHKITKYKGICEHPEHEDFMANDILMKCRRMDENGDKIKGYSHVQIRPLQLLFVYSTSTITKYYCILCKRKEIMAEQAMLEDI